MVISKRCKICTALDAENIPISGEYFDKLLPELILKISGMELDPRKINGVLVCKLCALQLIHTDVIIHKLRNALHRLQKPTKESKPKTPSKDPAATHDKNVSDVKKSAANGMSCENSNKVESNENSTKMEDEKKTPKKVVRRKSVFPDGSQTNINEDSISNGGNADMITSMKFKKIADTERAFINKTPAKPSKRKQDHMQNENTTNKKNSDKYGGDITPIKRNKTTSIHLNEDTPMDLTVDEHDDTDTFNENGVSGKKIKVSNCVICGKGFNQKSLLRDHIEASHMGEKLKECPHCSTEFRSQQKYESHVFSEKCKTATHSCQYPKCNKRFKTIHKMELHMHEKHLSQQEQEAT